MIYSWDEIRRHNKVSDGWIVANNNVYDVTNFINIHPGGKNAIIKNLGKDCTRDYNFHTKNGKKDWTKYKIGTVEKEEDLNCCIIM